MTKNLTKEELLEDVLSRVRNETNYYFAKKVRVLLLNNHYRTYKKYSRLNDYELPDIGMENEFRYLKFNAINMSYRKNDDYALLFAIFIAKYIGTFETIGDL